jgi:topoisomerase-4 subunit A
VRARQGKGFLTLDTDDVPLRPALFTPGMARVLCVSAEGKALVFGLDELKVLRNGGRGLILMGLDPKDALRQAIVFGGAGVRIRGAGRGGKEVDRVFGASSLEAWAGARARKGRLLEPRVKDAQLELA